MIYRGYVEDAVHEGSEQRLSDGPVAGHAHGAKCRAVVATAPGDNLVALVKSAQELDLFCNVDCRLDRFGSAAREEHPIEIAWRQPGYLLRPPDCRHGGMPRSADIRELAHLLGSGVGDLCATMAYVDQHQPGNRVDEPAAVHVVEIDPITVLEDMHGVPLDHVCPGRLVNPDVFDGRLFNRGCRVERVMRVSAPSGEECCHKTSGRAALLAKVFLSQFALGTRHSFRGGHEPFRPRAQLARCEY